ncbi:hypothetical protein AAGC94_08895 [Clostridium sporogenes]|uniref:Uncharacterized protein n=1 Tax=Clostridium sporogenes TaxID=1509 RepID=A0A7X5PAC4_CLOSG|nr:hypothetical protein [Clostridium sporogenes]AJD32329.1 putative membrane protein [Clostridium botulinum Prevot_594]KRU46383.1 hypothetical protein VT94_05570 [Clostridium sporogenes]MBW5458328.1 hypothetical protein [Clostridium sporogenes]MBY7016356.1 hypothetical protein [Clostridium sporogenes]MBY7064934.1 hypothetical protein [Clostridium sporogenes]
MLKIGITELFVRTLPESFLVIFVIQAFSNSKMNKSKYVLSSTLLSIVIYSIRLLPIHYGVHTILNLIAIIVICTFINEVTPIKSITYSLILMSLLALSEALNLYFIYKIFGENIVNTLKDPLKKCIYLMPSIIILLIIVLFTLKVKNRRVKDVFH